MESPPSSSSWSQAFILSDDSGLLLTTGSYSSSNLSCEKRQYHYEDSDCEERSLSQYDSLDGVSDVMYGENFNTLKKGPHWTEVKQSASPIEPPLEFQDGALPLSVVDFFCAKLTNEILATAFSDAHFSINFPLKKYMEPCCLPSPPPLPCRIKTNVKKLCADSHSVSKSSPHLNRQSPYRSCRSFPSPTSTFASSASPYVSHTPRPSSRSSLGGSSRLSSSYNSLSVPHARRVDDSTFITQAVSHDTLSSNLISDLYNVPFDSDVYAVPVDVVHNSASNDKSFDRDDVTYNSLGSVNNSLRGGSGGGTGSNYGGAFKRNRNFLLPMGTKDEKRYHDKKYQQSSEKKVQASWHDTKRHSVAGTSSAQNNEPVHMSLQEVRKYLQSMYSSSSSETIEENYNKCGRNLDLINSNTSTNNHKYHGTSIGCLGNNQISIRPKKPLFLKNIRNKKGKDNCDKSKHANLSSQGKPEDGRRRIFNLKQALCNIFRFRRFLSVEEKTDKNEIDKNPYEISKEPQRNSCLSSRALPPLPPKEEKQQQQANVEKNEQNEEITTNNQVVEQQALDFSASLRRVKDYGWYWGPISCEAAEKVLSNEPDGSFIVRDSSDDHYIFSLTFKLNNSVRHVRIDHDQGNFSFGNCTKFKSQTIVDFIENAVEHSRSGRYLFFLHRRPVIGPVRVQLLHPVSRFKQVQSLQHMCRFVIHKNVRVDLIPKLPLPRRMIDYLNTPHYYAEHLINVCENNEQSNNNSPTLNEPVEMSFRNGFVPPALPYSLLNGNDRRYNNIRDRNIETNNNDNTNNINSNHLNNVPVNEYIVFNAIHSNNSNSSLLNGRNTPFEPIFRQN